MTPLPTNPSITVLLDDKDQVVGIATNVAPLDELTVNVTRSQRMFDKELAPGNPFVCGSSAQMPVNDFPGAP